MQGKQLVRYVLLALVTAVTTCVAATPPVPTPAPIPVVPAVPVVSASTPALAPVQTTVQTPTATPAASVSLSPSQTAQVWNLKNADIRAVIQTMSILTGKNFIVDPRVHGNVTLISQKAMTPDEMYQVFLSMLQLLQFVAIPSGGAVKIVPSMDANALSRQVATDAAPGTGDEIVVRVVPVEHVSATELVPVLRPLMSQSGSVSAYLPSNSLILAGTASNINRLIEVAKQMDSVNVNQVKVVHLQYANAKKVVAIIHSLQSGNAQGNANNATLAADEENNSILINGNTANQLLMGQLIGKLDRPGAGGDDTRVVMLNYLSAKKFAPILEKIAHGIGASAPAATGDAGKAAPAVSADIGSGDEKNISVQAETTENAIIMHAPKALLSSLMAVIRRLDVRPREVLVEAIIVKVDQNLLDKLGIEWGTPGTGAVTSIGDTGSFLGKINPQGGVGLLPNGNIIGLLHALKTDGATDILSTPSVVVLDNEKASIVDGQNIGVANRQYQGVNATPGVTDNSISPYNTIERQDVALGLDVTPHISPNSMIRMTLLQKDDSLSSSTSTTSQQQDNPTINTTKIKTSVLVKSGDILVLGGLTSNEQDNTTEKLPVLGDLPLIGHLFRYTTHTITKKNLMVFIRPVVMKGRTAYQQTLGRYRYLRDAEIGVQTEKIANDPYPLLPHIGKEKTVLPQPVSSFYLPTPGVTNTTAG